MDDIEYHVTEVLSAVLGRSFAADGTSASTPLLGSVAELDSMAVVAILASLEERLGFGIPDDEIDGSLFATVGSLTEFLRAKAAG